MTIMFNLLGFLTRRRKSVTAPVEGEKGELVPIHPKERHRCPYYGFAMPPGAGVLIDQRGNQCALEGAYVPCCMETSGINPDWEECSRFNHAGNDEALERIAESHKVFPDEFRPENATGWQGLPLSDWQDYIMKPKK